MRLHIHRQHDSKNSSPCKSKYAYVQYLMAVNGAIKFIESIKKSVTQIKYFCEKLGYIH